MPRADFADSASARPTISRRASLGRLLRYLRPHWRQQAVTLCFLVGATGAGLLVPLLVKRIVDVALPARDAAQLIRIVAAMAGVHLLSSLLMLATDYFFLRVSNAIVLDLRRDMHDHLLRLSLDFFEGNKAGQTMARIMGDVDTVQMLTTNAFLMLLTDSFSVLLMLGFMLYLSWPLTLVSVATLVLLVLITRLFSRRLLVSARLSREKYAAISEDLQETIAGVKEIKVFAREPLRGASFTARLADYARANFRLGMWGTGTRLLNSLVMALGPVLVYYYGGRSVIGGTATIGLLVAFVIYLERMYESLYRLSYLNIQAQSALGAVERIFALLDAPPTVQESPTPVELPAPRGEVELQGVSFRYVADRPPALRNVSLRVRAGERVALVGRSGSGKSTVASLVCRFYDTQDGRVLLDGRDVRDLRLTDLRAAIGIVPQEAFFFHASVAENLRFARPEATRDELEAATRQADAHDFILGMPAGYDTIIGERGSRLSGGQKQRLAIARVLLRDPRIVILDEATSALDAETERQVRTAMACLAHGRTTLVISHRLTTVADADRILVLDEGELVAEGDHRALLSRDGVYRRLYEQQAQEAALGGADS